jgi:hypothetical protein
MGLSFTVIFEPPSLAEPRAILHAGLESAR